jgi:hypothetical protein
MSRSQRTSGGGRRIAARRRRRTLDPGALLLLAPPLVAVVIAFAVNAVPVGDSATQRASTVPVDDVVNACQRVRLPEPQAAPSVRMLSAQGADLATGGTVHYTPTGDGADADKVETRRGRLSTLRAPGASASAGIVHAEGAIAAGTATWQVDRGATDPTVAVQECLAPRAHWWFTGAGASLDHQSKLVMTNTDPGRAVVDVTLRGPAGEVEEAVGVRGLTVQPGETVTVPMVEVAPQNDEITVEVSASRGRVVAAVADQVAEGAGTPTGTEWLPAAAPPDREVVLSGTPTLAGARTLVVANPSSTRQALVEVLVAGADGAFAPTEGAEISVPPGSVATSDLSAALGTETAAVLLRSNVPVTGAVRSTVGSDVTYAGAVSPLTGPAAAVLDGPGATVQVTAGDQAATATVTAFTEDGDDVGSKKLEATTRGTVEWKVPRAADYVLVEPERGQVSGAVILTGPAGVSTVPLRDLPLTLTRPAVVPALG